MGAIATIIKSTQGGKGRGTNKCNNEGHKAIIKVNQTTKWAGGGTNKQ